MITWLGDKLWIKTLFQKRLGVPDQRFCSVSITSRMPRVRFSARISRAGILTSMGSRGGDGGHGHGKAPNVNCSRDPHSPFFGLLFIALSPHSWFEVKEGNIK